ncbi:hypothetical protein BWI96_13765 [Siphonobacter sp. SORGH_AS_0500]|uniref:Fic family protein n=2 Tax=Siphonobacter sp. SORGH_AS_0500 TaxID=1864824 RepID=UPI000CC0BE34|nr:Fic family protein [Siphonobacter sp. SORGH_AS_0500]PKK36078.1 hypothetical protein BWI96_13765 [Siphonobacter sp. SORGH_AS_0500]
MNATLSNTYYDDYLSSLLTLDFSAAFAELKSKDWTIDNFKFYTAVSVMASSRIEGESLEVDSYVKHKLLDIEYLPTLTEKPNDLYRAYEFARDHSLTLNHFLQAHSIATEHLLPEAFRGKVRNRNMLIMDQQSNRIRYEAASGNVVKEEFEIFWSEVNALIQQELSLEEAFYYAAFIHLVFVKIHPFNDGNGRTARLLEKWFLASKLGEKAWYLGSEFYYYTHLQDYYNHLGRVGLFYKALDYDKALPFLRMLPLSLVYK